MHFRIILLVLLLLPFMVKGQVYEDKRVKKAVELFEEGKFEQALKQLNSIRKSATYGDSLYVVATMFSAHVNYELYNYPEAIELTEEIIRLRPNEEFNAQNHILIMKKYLGDFEGAIRAGKRILEINPADDIAYTNLASAYNDAGKYLNTLELLDKNPNMEPLFAEYYHKAVAFYHLAMYDSAQYYIDIYMSTGESTDGFFGYKIAALIHEKNGDTAESCRYITLANETIIENDYERRLRSSPAHFRQMYIYKHTIENIEHVRELKTRLCIE